MQLVKELRYLKWLWSGRHHCCDRECIDPLKFVNIFDERRSVTSLVSLLKVERNIKHAFKHFRRVFVWKGSLLLVPLSHIVWPCVSTNQFALSSAILGVWTVLRTFDYVPKRTSLNRLSYDARNMWPSKITQHNQTWHHITDIPNVTQTNIA